MNASMMRYFGGNSKDGNVEPLLGRRILLNKSYGEFLNWKRGASTWQTGPNTFI